MVFGHPPERKKKQRYVIGGIWPSTSPPKKKNGQEQLSTFWPPKKLPSLPSVWTAVDAFDPARQGRTLETVAAVVAVGFLGGRFKGAKVVMKGII